MSPLLAPKISGSRERPNSSQFIIDKKALQKIRGIVNRVMRAHSIPPELFDEAYGDVLLALTKLLPRFDPRRNDNFWVYAYSRIQGAVLDVARQHDTVSREERKKLKSGEKPARPVPRLVTLNEALDLPSHAPEVESRLLRQQMHAAIVCDGILTERERAILRRRFKGDTLGEIGDDFDLTDARISQIISDEIAPKLRRAIKEGKVKM